MAAFFSIFLLLLTLCFRRQRTVPSSSSETTTTTSKPLRRFSYSSLRRATSSFSPSLRLGQGGSGSVFRGILKPDLNIAVKLMDSGSLQGEREFQNELYFGGKIDSEYVVSVIGFCSDLKRRRMLLVYELLANGSLQDCLLHRKCSELMDWKIRFSIALNIAKGLEYLHHFCDPPIIHGDIKPSNILLDDHYSAKISDFGLAKMKSLEIQSEIRAKNEGNLGNEVAIEENWFEKVKNEGNLGNEIAVEDNRFEIEEEEITVLGGGVLPESCLVRVVETPESMAIGVDFSPETETVVSPRIVAAMASPVEMFGMGISSDNFDSVMSNGCDRKQRNKHSGEFASRTGGSIRNDVTDRPKSGWIRKLSSNGKKDLEKNTNPRKFKWWVSLDDVKDVRRPAREWWKEEYTEELSRKKKKKKKQETASDGGYIDNERWYSEPKKKNRSRSSWSGSMDWWSDGLSGNLRKARRTSYDSGGFSSTPSLRGTVCYIAPEYRIRGDLSEKCDVYSYGVLLLVLISGRRPLEVTGSSMDDFQRPNLVSWARNLARGGRLLDLVDQKIQYLDKGQALLCINVALLCLQKSAANRPSMQEIAGMLSGELDSPELPPEFSLSKHNKSRKKS